MLKINNLQVSVGEKEILKGLTLTVNPGEIQVVMGPNGSGKSTLAYTLAGHPKYKVIGGGLTIDGKKLADKTPDQRAKMGLFLAWQNSIDVTGVKVFKLLKEGYGCLVDAEISAIEFRNLAAKKLKQIGLKEDFWGREIKNFSGGERKRWELLQALILQPKYAILDEVDSGMDIEGLKLVGKVVKILQRESVGIIFITHQVKSLERLRFKKIHVLMDGRIVDSGGKEIWEKLEKRGYRGYRR